MQKGRKGFDFGFAADDDDPDDGKPEVRTVPTVRKQEFRSDASLKVRPAQYPNTESFAGTNTSIISGGNSSSFADPNRAVGDSAALLGTSKSASQRLKELNAYEL